MNKYKTLSSQLNLIQSLPPSFRSARSVGERAALPNGGAPAEDRRAIAIDRPLPDEPRDALPDSEVQPVARERRLETLVGVGVGPAPGQLPVRRAPPTFCNFLRLWRGASRTVPLRGRCALV